MSQPLTGIERYFLEQKMARLNELKAKIAGRIGFAEAQDLYRWYAVVKDIGCPNCGIDFREMPPEHNIYPHWTGACALQKFS